MPFPGQYDSFDTSMQGTTLVAGDDHANNHRVAGSALGSIERVLGTTNGTQVLMNFAAGDFAARINSGGTLQQTLFGTFNSGVLGTPAVTGGTLTNPVISTGTATGGFSLSANGSITQTGAADHLTLTPGASKLVRSAALRQDGTTNTYKNNTVLLHGWGFIHSANAVGTITKGITFGITFTTAPTVQINSIGDFNGGGADPTAITQFATNSTQPTSTKNISTTGFTAVIQDSNAYGTADCLGFAWTAIGDL